MCVVRISCNKALPFLYYGAEEQGKHQQPVLECAIQHDRTIFKFNSVRNGNLLLHLPYETKQDINHAANHQTKN